MSHIVFTLGEETPLIGLQIFWIEISRENLCADYLHYLCEIHNYFLLISFPYILIHPQMKNVLYLLFAEDNTLFHHAFMKPNHSRKPLAKSKEDTIKRQGYSNNVT